MFTIEKLVSLPSLRRTQVYPFKDLEVGDSFFVPSDKAKANSVRACSSIYSKRHGIKLTCKKVEGGIRVWRVS